MGSTSGLDDLHRFGGSRNRAERRSVVGSVFDSPGTSHSHPESAGVDGRLFVRIGSAPSRRSTANIVMVSLWTGIDVSVGRPVLAHGIWRCGFRHGYHFPHDI